MKSEIGKRRRELRRAAIHEAKRLYRHPARRIAARFAGQLKTSRAMRMRAQVRSRKPPAA